MSYFAYTPEMENEYNQHKKRKPKKMKTTHTPAPWCVVDHTDGHSKPYYILAQFNKPLDEYERSVEEMFTEHEANAKLMSHAPVLLEALRRLMVSGDIAVGKTADEMETDYAFARDVLKKLENV